ncbi:MAG: NAD+ synthase, partial [Candidatus Thorarchaeota archaeon]
EKNQIKTIVNKRLLPNYDVFDERRYFSYDNQFDPVEINEHKVGILICEDLWDEFYELKVAKELVKRGAEILIVINASPYHIGKFQLRKELVCKKSLEFSVPIVYVNMVGGQDEIVYDGQSFVTNKFGKIIYKSKAFKEEISVLNISIVSDKKTKEKDYSSNWKQNVLDALKLNLYDYFHKSSLFTGVVLGLSGGIDSAFTAFVCAKALGSEKVTAIMLPSQFTSQESILLAKKLCKNLNIKYIEHPIDDLFRSYQKSLKTNIGDFSFDIADENLQARIRATLLMYYSNKFDWLLVSTGNKSEIGVGYCTLYGDTDGGKNIPGDLLKTQIYDICEWINRDSEVIPKEIINRIPTAELRENQKDSDTLPEYDILDTILEEIINHGLGLEFDKLNSKGIDNDTILNVRNLYLNSEFKRRQLVQTIKVSKSAFGIGRRYPVLKRIKL